MEKTLDRPKVSLAKASQPNEILSIDLKEIKADNLHILFITDKCTRYTRGQVIKTKQPRDVIQAIETNWVLQCPGWPSKGFFSDQGGEFCNSLMKEYTRKIGVSHKTTPSFSPWANGLCERNHTTVDRTLIKLRQENPTCSYRRQLT